MLGSQLCGGRCQRWGSRWRQRRRQRGTCRWSPLARWCCIAPSSQRGGLAGDSSVKNWNWTTTKMFSTCLLENHEENVANIGQEKNYDGPDFHQSQIFLHHILFFCSLLHRLQKLFNRLLPEVLLLRWRRLDWFLEDVKCPSDQFLVPRSLTFWLLETLVRILCLSCSPAEDSESLVNTECFRLPDVVHIEETIQWQNHEHERKGEWVACSVKEVRDLSEIVEDKTYSSLIERNHLGWRIDMTR